MVFTWGRSGISDAACATSKPPCSQSSAASLFAAGYYLLNMILRWAVNNESLLTRNPLVV